MGSSFESGFLISIFLYHPNNHLENISNLYLHLFNTLQKKSCSYAVSPQGRTQKGKALDRKPGARTIDSRGERLA